MLNLIFLLPFFLDLVLDEGDAKYLYYRRVVAQSLSQPEPICIRDVLLKDTADQAQLGCERHKNFWLEKVLLKIRHQ